MKSAATMCLISTPGEPVICDGGCGLAACPKASAASPSRHGPSCDCGHWACEGATPPSLRIAYADPPYPGCAHLYADHPDYNGEVDHEALITELVGYDGWALSTSSKALQQILFFCPEHVRVLVWVKNTVRYAWEPVIVSPARVPDDNVRDWIHVEPEMYQWRPKPAEHVIGQKPEPFCRWLFSWLGAEPQDDFVDMFPGSGAVGRAWERFASEIPLGPNKPKNLRSSKRAARKALRQHPTLEST